MRRYFPAQFPALLWICFIACAAGLPGSLIQQGRFPDSDDYIYMTQTLDWLQGQGWYDNVQYRLDPPAGAQIHFFHLAEAPLAFFTLLMHGAGFDWMRAAVIAAGIWPPLLLAGLLAAMCWMAASLMPREATGLTALVALFMTPLLYQFTPGHVHHHGLVLLLVAIGFGCVLRMMAKPEKIAWGASAGFLLALGQAVALETLPWLALFSAWIVIWMIVKGRAAAKSGLIFGLALFLSAALLLMLMLPSSKWLTFNMIAYSPVYVLLTAAVCITCAGVALAARTKFAWLRYAAGIGLGALSAALFFMAFPELIHGPWGAVNKTIALLYASNVAETYPLIALPGSAAPEAPDPIVAIFLLALPALALAASIAFLRKAARNDVWLWALTIIVLAAGILLSAFYQIRFVPYLELFSIMPLTAGLQRGLSWSAQRWRGWRFAAVKAGLAVPVLLGLFILLIQFAALDAKPPAVKDVARILNNPGIYGTHSYVIINMPNEGAELLFRTHHSVLAAPYHGDVEGNLDALKFFFTSNPDVAEKIARAHHAELVLMNYAMFKPLEESGHSIPHDAGPDARPGAPSFAIQLARGFVPVWLKPVKLPLPPDYFLFEVRP